MCNGNHHSLKWWSLEVLTLLSGLLPNPKLETSVLSTWYVCMQHFMITYFMLNSSFVYSTDPHILFISLMISSLYFFIPFGLVVVARLVQYSCFFLKTLETSHNLCFLAMSFKTTNVKHSIQATSFNTVSQLLLYCVSL